MQTDDPTKADVLEQKEQESEQVEGQPLSEDELNSISGSVTSTGETCIF